MIINAKHPIKRTQIVPSNPLKADPTRSKTLRNQFTREITRRFRDLKGKINDLIIREDAFGLKRFNQQRFGTINVGQDYETRIETISTLLPSRWGSRSYRSLRSSRYARRTHTNRNRTFGNATRKDHYSNQIQEGKESPVINIRFAFQTDAQKVISFRAWLQTQFSPIVPSSPDVDAFFEEFVRQGYRKGAGRAFEDTRRLQRAAAGSSEELAFFEGTKEQFLRQSFAQPVAIDKVKLLAGRVFTELKGITDEISKVLTRELAEGLARGDNPNVIARQLNQSIDTIGIKRARRIARTEIVRAHAEGQLDALEQLDVVDVGVAVEWSTAGDDRVCLMCQPLDGVVMPIKEARGIIPRHPNCRCAFIPANVGESTKGQKRSKSAVDTAFKSSIRAEIPKKSKRSVGTQRRLSTWSGADKKISKKRPKSIL